jgi:hypothetical protein
MPPKPQNIHVDRVRLSASWASWWAMFVVISIGAGATCRGVWHLRGATANIEQVVKEVKELRVEMKVTQEKQHQLEIEMKGVKTKLGITANFSDPVVTAAN